MDEVWVDVRPAVALVIAFAAGLLVALVVGGVVRRIGRRHPGSIFELLHRRCRRAFRATLATAAVLAAVPTADLRDDRLALHLATLAVIAAVAWLFVQLSAVVEDVATARFDIDVVDNLHARRVRTQILVLRRVLVALVIFVAIAAELLTFRQVRALGASFLASAGVLSVVAGLAAQTTLANLFAGIQIALSDQIRIEDVVVVNGEWGRIEEITLTYVIVRTWDNRRLVLPVSWFTTNVFQNWTRHEARVVGNVLLHVDYTVPVDELRREMTDYVQASPLWDGRDLVLQVVDSTPTTMVLRGVMSSPDAPSNWDLRCGVREHLLTYVRDHYPASLPRLRTEVGTLVVPPAAPGAPPGPAAAPAAGPAAGAAAAPAAAPVDGAGPAR